MTKRQRLYEEANPETTKCGVAKEKKRGKKGIFVKSTKKDLFIVDGEKIEPAERFTKSTAKVLKVSEQTVKERVRVGEAILKGEFNDETVELFKKGIRSHHKLIKELKAKRKAKKKEIKFQIPMTFIEKPGVYIADLPKWCKVCDDSTERSCPICAQRVLLCTQHSKLIKVDKEGCDDYNE